jgi:histidinol-phosphatase (PHP family)
MILSAIDNSLTTFCLTEHMPRSSRDLYPEEAASGASEASLTRLYDDFIREASRLRQTHGSRINLFLGFECEWISAGDSLARAQQLLERYGARSNPAAPGLDLFVGSVHHVHGIPIDYDHEMYASAVAQSGGSEEKLFADYFDAQEAMLAALKPPVVGHLDLIRLKSAEPDGSLRRWESVWGRVRRNLELVRSYGGVLEVNTSGLRKGLKEAYPMGEICEVSLILFHFGRGPFDLFLRERMAGRRDQGQAITDGKSLVRKTALALHGRRFHPLRRQP